jgi:hypothetical protein
MATLTESDEERIFKQYVLPIVTAEYIEYGKGFIHFREKETQKCFTISVKQRIKKVKKIKKVTFKPDYI